MKTSVIIPVYNAERFLERAIDSALEQPETGEVVLIEDCSPDNSIDICRAYAKKHTRVRLLQHPDKQNHGASASRNLGMRSAQCEYISFLDADDFFVENRFAKTVELFQQYPNIDGVYEAIGSYYYDDEAKEKHLARMSGNKRNRLLDPEITFINKEIAPEDLFDRLVQADSGWFSLDGVTIKRSLLEKTGYMAEDIHLGEDTEFTWRLAYFGRMMHGDLLHAVTMRGVHNENRVLSDSYQAKEAKRSMRNFWERALAFCLANDMKKETAYVIVSRYLDTQQLEHQTGNSMMRKLGKSVLMGKLLLTHPRLVRKIW